MLEWKVNSTHYKFFLLDGDERSTWTPGHFAPGDKAPRTQNMTLDTHRRRYRRSSEYKNLLHMSGRLS